MKDITIRKEENDHWSAYLGDRMIVMATSLEDIGYYIKENALFIMVMDSPRCKKCGSVQFVHRTHNLCVVCLEKEEES